MAKTFKQMNKEELVKATESLKLTDEVVAIAKDPENPIVYFQGQYRYLPELWETDTLDKQRKIARYVIEQNTVR